MSDAANTIEQHLAPVRGREQRSRSVATRFTRAEESLLLRTATAKGKNLREWAREVLLSAASDSAPKEADPLFTEMQALRLLLVNTLEPLLRGETMTAEQFREMLRYVKTNKHKAANDMLTTYIQKGADRP
jgi:hypothetical protein